MGGRAGNAHALGLVRLRPCNFIFLVIDIWYRPLLFLLLVLPQELNAHRLTHLFRNPGCFCSINSPNPHAVTESAIFVMPSGGLKGSVVAACARKTKKCGYFGMSLYYVCRWCCLITLPVNLTAIFANTTAGFPVRSYPLRSMYPFIHSVWCCFNLYTPSCWRTSGATNSLRR